MIAISANTCTLDSTRSRGRCEPEASNTFDDFMEERSMMSTHHCTIEYRLQSLEVHARNGSSTPHVHTYYPRTRCTEPSNASHSWRLQCNTQRSRSSSIGWRYRTAESVVHWYTLLLVFYACRCQKSSTACSTQNMCAVLGCASPCPWARGDGS